MCLPESQDDWRSMTQNVLAWTVICWSAWWWVYQEIGDKSRVCYYILSTHLTLEDQKGWRAIRIEEDSWRYTLSVKKVIEYETSSPDHEEALEEDHLHVWNGTVWYCLQQKSECPIVWQVSRKLVEEGQELDSGWVRRVNLKQDC